MKLRNYDTNYFYPNIFCYPLLILQLARALFTNIAEAADELSFKKGDIVSVIEKDYGGVNGWWLCQLHGRSGIVPFNYVQELTKDEIDIVFPGLLASGEVEGMGVDSSGYSQVPSLDTGVVVDSERDRYAVPRPVEELTVSQGKRMLEHVGHVLEACEARSNSLGAHDSAWLEASVLPKAVEQLGVAGREAHAALHDLVRLSLGVLQKARELKNAGRLPNLCQQLAQPIIPIKESHKHLQRLLEDLERGTDIPSVRQTLQELRILLGSLQPHVKELTAYTLANDTNLFHPDPPPAVRGHTPVAEPDYSSPRQPAAVSTPSPSTSSTRVDEDRTPLVAQPDHSALMERSTPSPPRVIVKNTSPLPDRRMTSRPLPIAPNGDYADDGGTLTNKRKHMIRPGHSDSSDSPDSTASSSRRNSISSDGNRTPKGPKPPALAGLNVAMGQLTESELSLLAYYAEHMDTLIPNVTNAVEAFCRAIGDKQAPKQFVWHSKMVVVGAYKMVYVADTVFQKLIHAELRNHVVACSNRLVECIKSIVASTKIAAQQYPSVSAQRDMVESVSHLPPLALELAESIKAAAHLR